MCAQLSLGERAEARLLKQAGLRRTPQRLAITREALTRNHLTVGEVYEAVRQQFPTIGLATVYATLSTLTQSGLVRALPFAAAVRYDVNMNSHANLVCTRCSRITDLNDCDDALSVLRERAARQVGFQCSSHPQGVRLDLYGLCRDCQGGSLSPVDLSPQPAPEEPDGCENHS